MLDRLLGSRLERLWQMQTSSDFMSNWFWYLSHWHHLRKRKFTLRQTKPFSPSEKEKHGRKKHTTRVGICYCSEFPGGYLLFHILRPSIFQASSQVHLPQPECLDIPCSSCVTGGNTGHWGNILKTGVKIPWAFLNLTWIMPERNGKNASLNKKTQIKYLGIFRFRY